MKQVKYKWWQNHGCFSQQVTTGIPSRPSRTHSTTSCPVPKCWWPYLIVSNQITSNYLSEYPLLCPSFLLLISFEFIVIWTLNEICTLLYPFQILASWIQTPLPLSLSFIPILVGPTPSKMMTICSILGRNQVLK